MLGSFPALDGWRVLFDKNIRCLREGGTSMKIMMYKKNYIVAVSSLLSWLLWIAVERCVGNYSADCYIVVTVRIERYGNGQRRTGIAQGTGSTDRMGSGL